MPLRCCLLALARCHNWVVFPCPDRERQGKRYNWRTILRWSRHSLVYPTIERQNALSIPLIAGSESGGWSSWRRERTQPPNYTTGSAQGIPFRQGSICQMSRRLFHDPSSWLANLSGAWSPTPGFSATTLRTSPSSLAGKLHKWLIRSSSSSARKLGECVEIARRRLKCIPIEFRDF